jgi:hypothetical protein
VSKKKSSVDSIDNYIVDVKNTDKTKFSITLAMLNKLQVQAEKMNKKPRIVLGIKRTDKEYFIVTCDITLERKD